MRGRWFAGWVVVGALGALTVLGALSIGIFVLPFFLLTGVLVARRTLYPADVLGLVSGIGAMLLVVAIIHRDDAPCPAGGLELPPGATSVSCGGVDPHPWWVAGAAFWIAGLATYAAIRLASRIWPCRRSAA